MHEFGTILEQGKRYEMGGNLKRARERYDLVIEKCKDPQKLAEAYRHRSGVSRTQCDWDAAISDARESARIAVEIADRELRALALNSEAIVYLWKGELEEADRLFHAALQHATSLKLRGASLQNIGIIAAQKKDLGTAREYFSRAYECFRDAPWEQGSAIALNNLGSVALDDKDPQRAIRVLEEGLAIANRIGDTEHIGFISLNLAQAYLETGRENKAESLASTALGHFCLLKNPKQQAAAFRVLGDIAMKKNHLDTASRMYHQGLQRARECGAAIEIGKLEERIEQCAVPLVAS